MTHRRKALGLLVSAVALLAMTGTASAGRVVVTGHDMDFHCNGNGSPNPANQCHYIKTALDFVRDPTVNPHGGNPVLVIDKRAGSLSNPSGYNEKVSNSLKYAYPTGVPAFVEADPADSNFAAEIGPLSSGGFSAVIIASDTTCGGCDLNSSSATPDSDIINSVAAGPIQTAFSAGTGIIGLAGAQHGDGTDPAHNNYYNFLPPSALATGIAVKRPFTLTDLGRDPAIGICDPNDKPSGATGPTVPSPGCGGLPTGTDDINCCATHNSFAEPAAARAAVRAATGGGSSSAFQVVERDSASKAETMFADVRKCGDRLCAVTHIGGSGKVPLPKCIKPKKKFTFKIPTFAPKFGTLASGKLTFLFKKKKRTFSFGSIKALKLKLPAFVKKGKPFKVTYKLTSRLSFTFTFTGRSKRC
jgi:hypothetical protein